MKCTDKGSMHCLGRAFLAALVCVGAAPAARAQERPPAAAAAAPGQAGDRAIRGKVLDESGRPIDGAAVATERYESSGNFAGEVSATTSRDGEFSIPDLEPGLYQVGVEVPPFVVVDGIPARGSRPGDYLTIRMARGAAISGTITDRDGLPLTGFTVEPIRVRDDRGIRTAVEYWGYRGGRSDDRGVYRLWGLQPGSYLLSVGQGMSYDSEPKYFSDRARTYYPGSDRSGATEVTVRAGDDVGNVDIAFRGDAGRRVTGTIAGVPKDAAPDSVSVEVYRAGTAWSELDVPALGLGDPFTFRIDGLDDGDYQLSAVRWSNEQPLRSERVPVRVRGADVSGVRLELLPLSTMTGRVEVQPTPPERACAATGDGEPPPLRVTEMAVRIRRVDHPNFAPWTRGLKADGSFMETKLGGTAYRLGLYLADDDAYVVALDRVAESPAPAKGKPSPRTPGETGVQSPIARDGLKAARGTTVAGIRFIVARGAARVRGRVAPARDGEALPTRARVCLVPADPRQTDDVIHYYEESMERDGTFDLRNIAPGEYFVVTRVLPEDDRPDLEIFPAAWDGAERAKLRAAAEKGAVRITLSPCQRLESAVVGAGPASGR